MNQIEIVEKLTKWMTEFVEMPNDKLGNWPPCPYARQARVNNKISIKFSTVDEFTDVVRESFDTLEDKEVVVICFDHRTVNPDFLKNLVEDMNHVLMPMNYVILEDHPDALEYVNGVKMNFGECGLLVLQKLDKLNKASEQLKEKGYYESWSQEELDEVVTWRSK